MSDVSSDRDPLDALAEEFVERFRRGERPALSEYTRQHPELAGEIRDLFPALVMLEDVRPATVAASGNKGDATTSSGGKKLERLGDFRILREVGRGGMGIVYEAEQESLGRHVALKVLPSQTLLDSRQLLRFQREARAAARLHHTNIVPVFGVGEHDGLHYYVMQYIHGQGLEQVLYQLVRLRQCSPQGKGSQGLIRGSLPAGEKAEGSADAPPQRQVAAEAGEPPASAWGDASAAVARSLLTGLFATPEQTPVAASAVLPGSSVPPLSVSGRRQSGEARANASSSSWTGQPGSDAGRPYWHSVARIGIQAAEALAYAHGQGTLHRDIKPSNLLLDSQGIVWVTDFGLAKANDSEDLTHTGDVVGTLRYMPPERLQGKGDGRSDVYALGLTLYELLTLRPAFDQSERSKLLHQVMNEEPPRPRKLNPAVPRDLETIVLKACARDSAHRYQSAAELADDLRRFTEDKPIRARAVSEAERLWRWCRRNPALAGLAALFVLSLLVGAASTTWKWREAEHERLRVVKAERETAVQRDEAIRARNNSQRLLTEVILDKGIALAEQGEIGEGLTWMLQALKVAPAESPDLARLIRTNLAAWRSQVHTLQYFEQAKPIQRCKFTPDGKQFFTATDQTLCLWDTATGRRITTLVLQPGDGSAKLSPDDKIIVTASFQGEDKPGVARCWDRKTGKAIGLPLAHPLPIHAVAFAPDSKQFATACGDGTVRLWDAATGQLVSDRFKHAGVAATCLAFSPNGRVLAVGTKKAVPGRAPAAAYLWDLASGQLLGPPLSHKAGVGVIDFSSDGKSVVTGSEHGMAQLWDAATGLASGPALVHPKAVNVARFTPDGRALVTGSQDGVVRWWDPTTGSELVGACPSHKMPVFDVAFSPDGQTLVTVSGWQGQGAIQVCRAPRTLSRPAARGKEISPRATWVAHDGEPWWNRQFASYRPDGAQVITGGGGGYARLVDTTTGQPMFLQHGGPFRHTWNAVGVTAYSPDGRFFASSSRDVTAQGGAHLWDAATGRPIGPQLAHVNYVSALAFSPDSKLLASGGYDVAVHFWDTATGQRVGPFLAQTDIVMSLAFSPDGRTLAVGHAKSYSGATGVDQWDVASRWRLGQAMPGPGAVVRYSPDGKRLLAAGGLTLRLWDAATGQPLGAPIAEEAEINSVAFQPAGQLFLVCRSDGTVRLRDAATGKAVGAPLLHSQRANVAVFSPDAEGRLVLVGCADGSAYLWDRAMQKRLGPPVMQSHPVLAAAFAPDGRSFLTTAADGSTRRWPVPAPEPLENDLDRLTLRLQVDTGLAMGEGQTVVQLTPGEWEQCRRQLADLESSAGSSPNASVSAWDYHDARARDAEQDGLPQTALWHLERLVAAQDRDSDAARSPIAWQAYARRARCHITLGERFDLAEADYARAQALSSPDQLLCWYRHCSADCQERRQWQAALWYLDRLIATAPSDWRFYADRALAHEKRGQLKERDADLAQAIERGADGEFLIQLANEHAGKSQWTRAAALLAKAGERGPIPVGAWHCHALACLQMGDRAAYRRICARLLEKAGPTPSPGPANALAWICAVGPDALDDYAQSLALAELAVSKAPLNRKAGVLNTLGAIAYRAGRYKEAIERLRDGIQASKGQGGVHDWLFLAMAHHRLGQTEEARKFLAKAALHVAEPGQPWANLEVEILRREATALVNGKATEARK